MSDLYPPERFEHDLKLMLEPSKWMVRRFCLKRWINERMEFGALGYEDGLYCFYSESGKKELSGGPEVPQTLVKEGWVAD